MTDRFAAVILYAMLGGFALIVLAFFVPSPTVTAWAAFRSTPGASVLALVLISLALGSLGMAVLSLRPHKAPKASPLLLKVVAVALPIAALGWNMIAPLFWLMPVFFVWRLSRVTHP